MDHLVLIRVVQAIEAGFAGATLTDLRVEAGRRYRLGFDARGRGRSLIVSLRPELPWIGRPAVGGAGPRLPRDPLAARALRALRGATLVGAARPPSDRSITLTFSSGERLVAELATHGANLLLLDRSGTVLAAARQPRSARRRLEIGEPYRPPSPPAKLVEPSRASAAEIDARLAAEVARGETEFEALRRSVFGVGSEGARLVLEESRAAGVSPGGLLLRRLAELGRGERDPVVLAPEDPAGARERGPLDPALLRLLPWDPAETPSGLQRFRREDAAATAGLYHDSLERALRFRDRSRALEAILRREIERVGAARARAAADLASFDDPERYRHWAEALLAGIGRARRVGSGALVPDPYDPEGREIVVPVDPGRSLPECAQGYFRRHRRAQRGAERAREREEELSRRGVRLGALLERAEAARGADPAALEHQMREAGIPVGLEPATRAGKAAALARRPRLEGVRMLTSSDGWSILIGRSARDNHRLTFDLAGPEDFWLHAQGCAGAHVVLRNESRLRQPPAPTLREAAAAAAWFSEARRQGWADVEWTRRKYVRHPRGAPPGKVLLKRSETLRVRPALPPCERARERDGERVEE